MIQNINQFKPETSFETDICVVGAGAAGIDISMFFNGTEKNVLLVESGDIKFIPEIQKLYEMKSIGKSIRNGEYNFNSHLAKNFKEECRVRMFGGTTNVWSGKWKMLEPIDFLKKDWLSFSGWPISYEDLLPYYNEVAEKYNIPSLTKCLIESQKTEITPSLFSKFPKLKYTIHYTQEPPLNFATAFYQQLEKSKNVKVILCVNAYELVLDCEHKKVQLLRLKTLEGKAYSVIAKVFILACGGLENARLLLNSNNQVKSGIGNSKDLVGRFYMDHPKGKLGIVKPLTNNTLSKLFLIENTNYKFGFSLSENEQQESETLNHNFYCQPIYDEYGKIYSDITKKLKSAFLTRSFYKLIEVIKELLLNYKAFLKALIKILLRKNQKILAYEITHYLEQSPNYDSKLFLGEEVDAIGMKKIVIDWQLSPLDKIYFERFINKMKEIFSESQLGEIMIDDEAHKNLEFVRDASHHMGTTRMGHTLDEGVVDSNCKVFGIENLYIAGSSVFPTGGNANPTYTILALSRRLCHHLVTYFTKETGSMDTARTI
ncbi:GMC family oxidoreductase [Scytonema sp. NUACC21]